VRLEEAEGPSDGVVAAPEGLTYDHVRLEDVVKSKGCQKRVVVFTISWVLWALGWGAASSFAQEPIQWLTIDFPPLFIVKGEFTGQGMADQSNALMQSLLLDYRHQNVKSNTKRALEALEQGGTCFNGAFKNAKRDAVGQFGMTNLVIPVHNLVMRKNIYDQHFAGQRKVSLEQLLKEDRLRFGYAAERSYGKTLSDIIDKYKNNKQLINNEGGNISSNLLRMLLKDRVDYVVEYPWVTRYEMEMIKHDQKQDIVLVQIEEFGESQFLAAGFYCSQKDGFGERVMTQLIPALQQAMSTTRYRGFVERWLDEGSIPGYRQAYNDLLLKPQGLPLLPVE
jgi:uncharacterized protein (TIGR02285 family)